MKWRTIIGLVILIGGIFGGLILLEMKTINKYHDIGLENDAVITGIVDDEDSTEVYATHVVDGQEYHGEIWPVPGMQVGQHVTIFYNQDDPKDFQYVSYTKVIWTMVIGGIFLVLCIIGALLPDRD